MSEDMLKLKEQITKLDRLVGELEERIVKLEEHNIGSGVIIDGVADGYRKVLEKELNGEDNR